MYDRILEYIKKGSGIYFKSEFTNQNISKYYINKLITDGVIEKYESGVYVRSDTFEDEYFILQHRSEIIIYSYNTALYLLNETERTPFHPDITVYSGYNAHRIKDKVNIHYVKKEYSQIGVITVLTNMGNPVKCYNKERVLIDMILHPSSLDKEQANKFIRKMFINKEVDFNKVIDYAKLMNCEKKIRNTMEIFL